MNENPDFFPSMMTEKQAAIYLGVKPQTLANWRCSKRYSLPYVKLGRAVRYRKKDLDDFVDQQRVGE